MSNNEQKFYSALEDVFIGEAGKKIEGKSGFVNLMKIKSQYFANIKPYIQKEIYEKISDAEEREELYQKLYTFFESYLNETGTPFFSKTPFHKNLYERVYSEKEDVTLFWKTQKLYYVKSEATYHSIQNMEIDDLVLDFDASNIEHQKSNEKKELEFYLTDATQDKLTFMVVYVDNSRSKYDRLKEYLKQDTPDKVRKYIADNFDELEHSQIIKQENNLNREGLKSSTLKDALFFINNDDSVNSVTIEFAVSKLDDMLEYAKVNNLHKVTEEVLKKAFSKYKKQNEVDYFIHKDAEGFLKEQFDLFIYNYLFNEKSLYNQWTTARIEHIQKLKEIAYSVIKYIAKFEDELKAIWNKPKFVRNSNYVFTLHKIADKPELIKKLIKHMGWKNQVEEWINLGVITGNNINRIINQNGNLDKIFQHLYIDTKHFQDIKFDLLNTFVEIDASLDGILIKSDNYQGLSHILPKYKDTIQTIYIDPPFNLGKDGDFFYKTSYKDSSWAAMLENRLKFSPQLLAKTGNIFVRCDHHGNWIVRKLLANEFGEENYRSEIILNRFKKKSDAFTTTTESLFFYSMSDNSKFFEIEKPRECIFCKTKIESKWQWMSSAGESKIPKRFQIDGEYKLLYPPRGRHWTNSQEKIYELTEEGKMRIDKNRSYTDVNGKRIPYTPERLQDENVEVDNNWTDIPGYVFGVFSAEKFPTQNSEEVLQRVILSSTNERDICLDFYLGSGTTTAVAHELNRKWIGIDVGDHFDSTILPRMKRIISTTFKSHDTKDGSIFKYYELEQYEDALARAKYNPKEDDISNINFTKDEKLLDAMVIDNQKEEVKMHFELLYPDVDIAETISNITGKKIKNLNKERVMFEDNTEIKFAEMNYNDPHFKEAYKKLLWWKSKV